jgi:hypothetical protein
MNRTAVKNFTIYGRKDLLEKVKVKAALLGVKENGVFDIELSKELLSVKNSLTAAINEKSINSDYYAGYYFVLEQVAYSWFSRLVAVRYMTVNGYIDEDVFSREENFKNNFISLCKKLQNNSPEIFVPTYDFSEFLLDISLKEKSSVAYKLLHSVAKEDFAEGVEILGWMHQYYNTDVFNLLYDGDMSKKKIPADYIPAATQLYTPDWVVKYMVENSLGRHWIDCLIGADDKNSALELKSRWKYYIEDTYSDCNELKEIRKSKKDLHLEDVRFIDPCMGSGHILVYAFDILMEMYINQGYKKEEAVKSILENNLYGIDIDDRAYHLAYFALVMKALAYDKNILNKNIKINLCSIQESNSIENPVEVINAVAQGEESVKEELEYLAKVFYDAKEYGSIINVRKVNFKSIYKSIEKSGENPIYGETIIKKVYPLVKQAEILTNHYDAVVTNPPYLNSSRMSTKLIDYVNREYNIAKNDLSTVFIQKVLGVLCKENGIISMITTVSWMYLKSFEKLRKYLLTSFQFNSIVDFGTELFEGKIGHLPVVSWVNRKHLPFEKIKSVRLAQYNYSKRSEKQSQFFNSKNYYLSHQLDFAKISGEPVAYWLSENLIQAFDKGRTLGDLTIARNGMKTGDNKRFLRLWWEVAEDDLSLDSHSAEEAFSSGKRWFPYNKGGEYRKWYGNNDYVVDWQNQGAVIMGDAKKDNRHTQDYPNELKFIPMVTWSLITVKPAFRYKECAISDIAGMSYFAMNDDLLYYLGFSNSVIATEIIKLLAPTMNCQVGDISKLPIIHSHEYQDEVVNLVKENIAVSKEDWDSFETSWNFKKHQFILYKNNKMNTKISDAYNNFETAAQQRFNKLKENEEKLNEIFLKIYNIQGDFQSEVKDKDITVALANKERDVKSFISYSVGCILGRYSPDKDGVVCSGNNWDIRKYTTFYPTTHNCVVVSDVENYENDLMSLFVNFVKTVFGEEYLTENLNFIGQALDPNTKDSLKTIRMYLYNDFYKDHCKTYCVGVSGKRPVYFMLNSGKYGGFKALVYVHRWDRETLTIIRDKFLYETEKFYKDMIFQMQLNNSVEENEKWNLKYLNNRIEEIQTFSDKLLSLEGISINYDDGIKFNHHKVQINRDGKKLKILEDI